MGYSKKPKAIDSNSDDHKPVIKQDSDGGFFYIVDSTDGEVGNRNDANQAAMNRKIEGSWPSFDEISKLGTERI